MLRALQCVVAAELFVAAVIFRDRTTLKCKSADVQSAEDADMLCQGLQFTTRHGRALAFSPVLERQLVARQEITGQGGPTWDP